VVGTNSEGEECIVVRRKANGEGTLTKAYPAVDFDLYPGVVSSFSSSTEALLLAQLFLPTHQSLFQTTEMPWGSARPLAPSFQNGVVVHNGRNGVEGGVGKNDVRRDHKHAIDHEGLDDSNIRGADNNFAVEEDRKHHAATAASTEWGSY